MHHPPRQPAAQRLDDLRQAATQLVRGGWPVLPGTFHNGRGSCWMGRPRADRLVPIADDWQTRWLCEEDSVAACWASEPYSLLSPCGHAFDVVVVPYRHTSVVVETLTTLTRRGVLVPTAVIAQRDWMLFVSPHSQVPAGLQSHPAVTVLGRGYWVVLPPTLMGSDGNSVAVSWTRHPNKTGWALPESAAVLDVLDHVLARTPTRDIAHRSRAGES